MSDGINCPKCDEPLDLNLVSRMKDDHRFVFRLAPGDGLFTAKQLGGIITQAAKFTEAMGREQGLKCQLLVEYLATMDTGEVHVGFISSIMKPPK